ncbi:DMT family transporter [Roseomonas gilardii subsp. gilardii]|uniref:DMT family transporter n=1 Tax=Roseomonas gilardii TaxID=257708 RepID=UPI001FF87161|nr:DMT family transporter [Roseomonas gilardii]UPG70975.1 DMT family transporter [Roseomonas gilardii subsp. gilardii]
MDKRTDTATDARFTSAAGRGPGAAMLTAYAQLAAAMSLVGVNVGVAKTLAATLPIAMIVGLRCLLAVALLLPLSLWRDGLRLPPPGALLNLFWQALLGTVLYNAALLLGLRLTTALEGGLMLATIPAAVALGAALLLRERLTPRGWAAALLAAGGIAAVTLARGGGGEAGGSLAGNALVLLAVCGEAAYALLSKRLAGRLPVVTASLWMQIFSALLLLPAWLPLALPWPGAAGALADPLLAGLLVFHGLTASLFSLLLWYSGLRRVPAGLAGVFMAFLPASAAATAVLFLGEPMTPAHLIGFALMLASLLLATWPSRRRA